MKKIFTLIFVLMAVTCGYAEDLTATFCDSYAGQLLITINDETTEPIPATVNITKKADNKIDLTLENFILQSGEDAMPVGNIRITDMSLMLDTEGMFADPSLNAVVFHATQNVVIAEGTLPGVDMWMGPMLGELPITVTGGATAEGIIVMIDIDLQETMGQTVHVQFSAAAQDAGSIPGMLTVTVNDVTTAPMDAAIILSSNEDNTWNIALNNFMLVDEEGVMPVGNIVVKNIVTNVDPELGAITFSTTQSLDITAGTLPGVDMWLGPMLGPIPVTLNGTYSQNGTIDINIYIDLQETMGQTIYVHFYAVDPTGIKDVRLDNTTNTVTYNLAGQRVDAATKGIVIRNGKKYMIK